MKSPDRTIPAGTFLYRENRLTKQQLRLIQLSAYIPEEKNDCLFYAVFS